MAGTLTTTNLKSWLILALLCIPALGASEEKAAKFSVKKKKQLENTKAPYVLSEVGMERMKKNIVIVIENIKNAKENLEITKGNIKIVKTELRELHKLEQEHFDLQKKYTAYLNLAASKTKKNAASIVRLQKWEKTLLGSKESSSEAGSDAFQRSLNKAQQEKANRKLWKEDTDSKVFRVKRIQREAKINLRAIEIRRQELTQELQQWNRREKSYAKLLKDLQNKKKRYKRIVNYQSTPPTAKPE